MKNILVVLLISALACTREQVTDKKDLAVQGAKNAAYVVKDALKPSVPVAAGPTPDEIERDRFNEAWRKQHSFLQAAVRQRADQAHAKARANADAKAQAMMASPQPGLVFVHEPTFSEKLEGTNPKAIASMPVRLPIKGDVNGPSVLKAQVLLDRANFSVGSIDGRWGKNSEIAVYWFQSQQAIEPTGDIDEATYRAIALAAGNEPALTNYIITEEDKKGPFVMIPQDVYEQANLVCLCYESLEEKLAESFHTTIETLQLLNPGTRIAELLAGQMILVPNVRKAMPESVAKDIAAIAISVEGNYLHGQDAAGNILFHAPATIGSKYDPSPTETLRVVKTAFNPQFKYQPKLFADVSDEKPETDLQPGPNSPVGVVWMALSKLHFGIHGTREPATIGYASSHGCIRLTNWDALDVARRTADDTPVHFVDTRESDKEETGK